VEDDRRVAGADQFLALWQRVEAGELTPAQAQEDAVNLGATLGEDICVNVYAAGDATEELAHSGRWKRGLALATLARAAALGITPRTPAADQCLIFATAAYIEVAHAVLVDHPDPELYEAARAAGEADAERAAGAGWPRLQGLLLFRLGSMLLDAYTTGRDPTAHNYEHELNLWRERAHHQNEPHLRRLLSTRLELDESGAVVRRPPVESMPAPLDALTIAEDFLRRAAPLVSDDRRGRTLKALAQTLAFKRALGGEVTEAEFLAVAGEALAALPADELQARLALLAMVGERGGPIDANDLISRLEEKFDTLQDDETTAWDAAGQAAGLLARSDPARALDVLMLRKRLTGPWDDQGAREGHYRLEIQLLVQRDAPDWVMADAQRDGSIASVSARALAEADAPPPRSTARSRAAACLAVLAAAAGFDEERIAIEQQERRRLSTIDSTLTGEHSEAVIYLVASLHEGEAVNQFGAGNHRRALREYARAAPIFLGCGLPARALHCSEGIDDLLKRGSIADVGDLARELVDWIWALELFMPEAARPVLRPLYGRAIWVALQHGNDPEVTLTLLQLAKGFVSSAWMVQGTRGFTLSENEKDQLSRAYALEQELPTTESPLRPAEDYGLFTEDQMLVAYAGMSEDTPADTVKDRLANLERQFEQQLVSHLVDAVERKPTAFTSAELQQALDERTVLLQLYYGPTLSDDEMAILSVIMTAESQSFGFDTASTTWLSHTLSAEDRSLTVSPLGNFVAELREGLQLDPRPRLVTPPSREALAAIPELYWRPLIEHLAELRTQGKDRLLIVPFGETHVCPLHLAGNGQGVLADDWTVSYSLGVSDLVRAVRARRSGANARSAGAAFGLSYENDPRMPTVPSSRVEVSAIASIMRTEPVMDAGATVNAVKRALGECRWVHVRAHGRHNVAAPFLQTVFLSPADGNDGRLRAHEIFELDLDGVEVVTLGACETSLTRVDYSDNSRGLTAALLAAGVGAVVGGLWNVLPDASTEFFTTFYRVLIGDGADVRDAYAEAQRHTRQKFPAYRDWGAFVLTGAPT
jgi:hypothetical protein